MIRWLVTLYSLAGGAAVFYGIWQVNESAAWIFGGGYLMFDAWRLSRAKIMTKGG